MNNKSKRIILICLIFIIGILLYTFLENEKIEYMQYKYFYENLENGSIEEVSIEDDSLKFKIENDEQMYYTENPNYDEFKEKLLLNEVSVTKNSTEENIAFVFDMLFYLMLFLL